jgi:ribokinase
VVVRELQKAGADTALIRKSDRPSGSAVIFVLPNGENTIVISPGANGGLCVEFALEAIHHLQPGDLLLCQLEIPLDAVQAALQQAHNNGAVTILDPAPACDLPDDLLCRVTILTPNQTEAAILLHDSQIPADFDQAAAAARKLQTRGASKAGR